MKFYTSVAKGLKLKVTEFWVLIFTFADVTEEKLVGGPFCPLPSPIRLNFRYRVFFLSKEFLDIQASTECRFTLKCVCDIIRTNGEIMIILITILGTIELVKLNPNDTNLMKTI